MHIEKLFDSFQRLELAKNRYIEGTGLGLNITKQLVSNMNGEITVSSEYGKGSCFAVKLPQEIIDNTPMGTLEQDQNRSIKTDSVSEQILYAPDAKVLVVDDNGMNLRVIKELLKRTGIQLDLATSGNKCLQRTKTKKYDLILIDHMMPEPDGIQTLRHLREDKNDPNNTTPVIVLTANATPGAEAEYLREGFVAYLSKPIVAEDMEHTLAKFLKNEKSI